MVVFDYSPALGLDNSLAVGGLVEGLTIVDLVGREAVEGVVRPIVVVQNGGLHGRIEMFAIRDRNAEEVAVLEDFVDGLDHAI